MRRAGLRGKHLAAPKDGQRAERTVGPRAGKMAAKRAALRVCYSVGSLGVRSVEPKADHLAGKRADLRAA